jgi:hypothetical protein
MTYWHLLDMFGVGSLVTEDSPVLFFYPDYATRAELYKFVDDELTAITPLISTCERMKLPCRSSSCL